MRRLLLVVVVVAMLTALFLFGLFRHSDDRDVPSSLIDKPAPAFSLPLYDRYQGAFGDTFRLADHVGTPMVINFWASWCAPCYAEAPVLQSGYERHRDEGVLFVGVQTQDRDKFDDGRQFLDRFGLSFPNGMDNDSRIGVDYALFGVPETYFVNAEGTVAYKQVGPVTAEVLDQHIEAMLP